MLKHDENLSLLIDPMPVLNKFNNLMNVINQTISDIYVYNYIFFNIFFHQILAYKTRK